MQNIVFWLFASIAIIAATFVVVAKNPVRTVLALIATFLATAVTWLMLEAEFLAITLVLVYVGAVMVLFLFVVMMLDIKAATNQAHFTQWVPVGSLLAIALFFAIHRVIVATNLNFNLSTPSLAYTQHETNTELLGLRVFTDYLLQFELAGVLLLVAIVAAIALIYRGPRSRKIQSVAQQVMVQAKDRVRLVDGT